MKITKRIVAAGTAGLLSATGLGLVVLSAPAATAATATAESAGGSRLQAIKDALASLVTDGKLTQAEADERTADLTERITTMVDQELPARGSGRGGRGGDTAPDAAPGASTAPSSGATSSSATSSSTT